MVEFKDNDYIEKYTYDNIGNMLEKNVNGDAISYLYNQGNQLITETLQEKIIKFIYNQNGDLIEKSSGEKYTYDIQGNLSSIKGNDIDQAFTYNGNGNRLSKTVDGETTYFVNDLNQRYEQVLQTYNDDGVIDTYTYGLQRISSKGETTETYLYDGRGSVVGVVGASNEFVSYSYTAYGELMPNSPQPHTFGYNGEQTDYATGMQYLRARYYDTGIQRFIQEDDYKGKFTNPISMNRYAYVHNNPVMGVDPSGYSLNRTIGQRILTGEKNQGIYKSSPIRKPSDKEKYGLTDGGSGMTAQDHRLADSLEQRQEDEKDIQDKVEAERVVAAEAAATAEAYRCAQSQEQEREQSNLKSDGVWSIVAGVAAVAVGVVVAIVGAPIAAIGIAAVIAVGAVSIVLGTASIKEANTGTNWIKDNLFFGNDTAYSAAQGLAFVGSVVGAITLLPFAISGVAASMAAKKAAALASKVGNVEDKIDDVGEAVGGAYSKIVANGGQRHHMPANSVSPYSTGSGPVIQMETTDHIQTASWGSGSAAAEYRLAQQELINQGKFLEAQQMDITDVQNLFGDNYNTAINQMVEYTKELINKSK